MFSIFEYCRSCLVPTSITHSLVRSQRGIVPAERMLQGSDSGGIKVNYLAETANDEN